MTLCAREGCGKPVPAVAIAALDPFCSRGCACAFYGVVYEPESRMEGGRYGNGGHARMFADGEARTPLQQARLVVSRRARVREGLRP